MSLAGRTTAFLSCVHVVRTCSGAHTEAYGRPRLAIETVEAVPGVRGTELVVNISYDHSF